MCKVVFRKLVDITILGVGFSTYAWVCLWFKVVIYCCFWWGTRRINNEIDKALGKPWRHKLQEGWWQGIDNASLGLPEDKWLLSVNKLLKMVILLTLVTLKGRCLDLQVIITLLLHQMTSMKGLNYQLLAMEKLLKQPILQDAMPDVVMNSKHYKTTLKLLTTWKEVSMVSRLVIVLMKWKLKMLLVIWLFQVLPKVLL